MVETIKYASVSIEEVIAAKLRLEANVFNVEARKAKEVLRNCKWELLQLKDFITGCYYGGRAKRNYISKYSKGAIGFLGSAEMLETNPQPVKFLSALSMDITPFKVKKGTILISRSGTIGNVTLVSNTLEKFLVSEHAIRIIPKEYNGYIYTYLNTHTGRTIVESNSFGAVILQIEPEHLETITIPNPSTDIKRKIDNITLESFELRDKSNQLLHEAESLLIKELNLPPFDQLRPESFNKNSDVRAFTVRIDMLNNRFDASYHNPIVSSILDIFLDNSECIKPLKELCNQITMPGIFKRVYVDEYNGVPFLGTDDILQLNPKIDKFLSTQVHRKLIEKDLVLNANTILQANRGSVSVGRVSLVPEYYEENLWVASQNCLRIVPNSIDLAGYIYVFLNSDYGNTLSRREIYGATIDMIDPSNAGQIPIPILKNKSAMKKINDLALTANKLRTEAFYKEKEAIKIMNDEVIFATKD